MKRIVPLLLALSLTLLSGCSSTGSVYTNYREIEQMLLIRTLGFDRSERQLRATVSGGEKGEYTDFIRMSAQADSVSAALDVLQDYTSWEELYFAHTRYILIGQDLAEQDLSEVLDYLKRSSQIGTDTSLYVVKGGSAEDLILHCGSEDNDVTAAMDSIVRDSERRGDGHDFSLQQVTTSLSENGAALLCAVEADDLSAVEEGAEEGQVTPNTCGYAILKGTRLVGFIEKENTRGVNFLMGRPGTGTITLLHTSGGTAALTISQGKVRLEPIWGTDGSLTGVKADIQAEAFVAEAEDAGRLDLSQLTRQFSRQLEQWVSSVLRSMADTEADFLGIGAQLRMQDPRRWEQMPQSWEDAIGGLTFEVRADCKITRTDPLQ